MCKILPMRYPIYIYNVCGLTFIFYSIFETFFSDIQQMALFIIREEMSDNYWKRTEIQFQCKEVLLVCGSYLCIVCLRVRNRFLLTALRILTKSEGPLHPQRFLRPPRPGITLQTIYTLDLDLGPFPTNCTHFLPNDQ